MGEGTLKLQILVPHFQYDPKLLLDSIAIQQSVDFSEIGVIIVYDGYDAVPIPRREYPFRVKEIFQPHGGISVARNTALDAASAEYIMLCDEDDMFFHACAVRLILDEIRQKKPDAMMSVFIEETPFRKYVNHEWDSIFVHGKVYRLDYLRENRIRFNPELQLHEDVFFNIMALNVTENIIYCTTPFYLWRWNGKSVTRSYIDFCKETYEHLLKSYDALVEDFSKRGLEGKAIFYASMIIEDAYRSKEERIKPFYEKHKKRWAEMPEDELDKMQETKKTQFSKKEITDWLCAI